MPLVLRERHKVINWLEDNRVEEGAKQLASEYRVTLLLEYVEPILINEYCDGRTQTTR